MSPQAQHLQNLAVRIVAATGYEQSQVILERTPLREPKTDGRIWHAYVYRNGQRESAYGKTQAGALGRLLRTIQKEQR